MTLTETSAFVVRPLRVEDARDVAAVHCASFADNALSRLGRGAVERHYLSLHHGPFELVALGAFRGSALLGFCYGGMLRGELSYFLARHRWYLIGCVAARPWLVASPLVRERVRAGLRLLRRPQQTGRRPSEVGSQAGRSFGILSIAVVPSSQRSGVGAVLIRAAEAEARRLGYAQMHLTVRPDNVRAVRFYEQLGWTIYASDGRQSTSMRRSVPPASPTETM